MNALVYVDIEQGIYKGENVELMEQIVFFWTVYIEMNEGTLTHCVWLYCKNLLLVLLQQRTTHLRSFCSNNFILAASRALIPIQLSAQSEGEVYIAACVSWTGPIYYLIK